MYWYVPGMYYELWARGCGSLDVASLVWVAWQSRRLQRGICDAACKALDQHGKETREGCKGDGAWLEWNVSMNCMSMHWYITSTYRYVLVFTKRCWKVERRHIGDFRLWEVKLGVLKEYMVVPKQTNTGWLPRTVHVVQPVHASMYLVCTSTYHYVLSSPKSFRGYYSFTFDNG